MAEAPKTERKAPTVSASGLEPVYADTFRIFPAAGGLVGVDLGIEIPGKENSQLDFSRRIVLAPAAALQLSQALQQLLKRKDAPAAAAPAAKAVEKAK